MELNFWKTLFL